MKNEYHLNRAYFQNPLKLQDIGVLQIGRYFCSGDTVVDTHVHLNLFELTIVTGGRGVVTTNGVAVPVGKGDIYLSMPGDTHKIVADAERPLKYDFFAFQCEGDSFQRELERIAGDYYSSKTRIFHDERVHGLVSQALAELNQESAYSKELLFCIFRQIIIYIIRAFQEISPEPYSAGVTHAEALCHRMMNYIDSHIYSLGKLEDLAAVADYSYGYLSALFKKTTGNTLSAYYQEKKMDAARLLILENKFRIVEIAEMLQFASVYSFSKAFSGYYGMSPRNYRASCTDGSCQSADCRV